MIKLIKDLTASIQPVAKVTKLTKYLTTCSDGMFFFLAGLFVYAYLNITAIGYTLLMNLPL
jgi:hypothetical protein